MSTQTIPVLKLGRQLLSNARGIQSAVNTIRKYGYQHIIVSAPGEADGQPNMTLVLHAMARNETSAHTNTRKLYYKHSLRDQEVMEVLTPVARFTLLAHTLLGGHVETYLSYVNDMETDFELAQKASTPQYPDPLVSRGEYWMARLLEAVLNTDGHSMFTVVNPEEFLRIDTDKSINIAASKQQLGGMAHHIKRITHMIVPGYYAGDTKGHIALLARNGTHTSATAIAILFQLEQVNVITDVPGIPIAPKRIVKSPVIPIVMHTELIELARDDPELFHPQAVTLMRTYHIDMHICTIDTPPHGGTLVTFKDNIRRYAPVVSAVGVDKSCMLLTATSDSFDQPGVIEKMGALVGPQYLNINIPYYTGSGGSFSYIIPEAQFPEQTIHYSLGRVFHNINVEVIPCAVVYIVGMGMEHIPGICVRFYNALSNQDINFIRNLPGNNHKLAVAIARGDVDRATKALYQEFFGTVEETSTLKTTTKSRYRIKRVQWRQGKMRRNTKHWLGRHLHKTR